MNLQDLNIRYINLSRSRKRKKLIESYFKDYNLIRISAVDGLKQWSDSTYDNFSRPNWDEEKLNKLIKSGQIASSYKRYYHLVPTEAGCNSSHIKAWEDFLKTDEEYSIFIEDDVQPVRDLKNIIIPDNANVFYLVDQTHPRNIISNYFNGEVKWSRTLMAYIFSRKAAELAIKAATPFYYQTDMQVPLRIYDSYKNYMRTKIPKWEELDRIKAYVTNKSYIIHSDVSLKSTFTQDGSKLWIKE